MSGVDDLRARLEIAEANLALTQKNLSDADVRLATLEETLRFIITTLIDERRSP